MDLDEALTRIDEIKAQIARVETFRGYRALTIGFSGLVGIGAAVLQAIFIHRPEQQAFDYLALWVAAAAFNLAIVGAQLAYHCFRAASPRTSRLTLLAVEQFLPCLIVGGVLTVFVALKTQESLWMLPGLWSLLFSLGVFASHRLFPRPMFWVGVFYLVAGGVCLAIGQGERALSPWLMAGAFGGGQFLTASILYWTLERDHEAQ